MSASAIEREALAMIGAGDGLRPAILKSQMAASAGAEVAGALAVALQERGFAVLKNGRLWLTATGQQIVGGR